MLKNFPQIDGETFYPGFRSCMIGALAGANAFWESTRIQCFPVPSGHGSTNHFASSSRKEHVASALPSGLALMKPFAPCVLSRLTLHVALHWCNLNCASGDSPPSSSASSVERVPLLSACRKWPDHEEFSSLGSSKVATFFPEPTSLEVASNLKQEEAPEMTSVPP